MADGGEIPRLGYFKIPYDDREREEVWEVAY
jgi:hypothetical protein